MKDDRVLPEWVAVAQVYAALAQAAAAWAAAHPDEDLDGDYLVFQEQAEIALSMAHANLARMVAV